VAVAPALIIRKEMNTTVTYTFGSNVAEAAPVRASVPAPLLFASVDGLVASLSNSECVFQPRGTGDTHVMTHHVLQALDKCREFRSLEEHAARIAAMTPGLNASPAGIRRVLDNLVARGLLVSNEDFVARMRTAGGSAAGGDGDPSLRAICIRACDRPTQLARLLTSLAEYERVFRMTRPYVLIDDSASASAADRNLDLLREFARSTGCKVTYVGTTQQQQIVQRLAKALPSSADTLAHLLLRPRGPAAGVFGGGRAWNLALLMSAGGSLVLLDDDLCLPLRRPDDAESGIDPDPSSVPETSFYPSMDEALNSATAIEDDPFALHLGAVGQTLGRLIAEPTFAIDPARLRGLNLGRLEHLRGDARIIGTVQGTCGSSRTESGAWLYHLDPESREAFWKDRESYLRNIEATSIRYGRRKAHVRAMANFTPFAIDNRRLLPCTNPLGRGEDSLFSVLASLCRPESLLLELPVVIGHIQESARKRSHRTTSAPAPRFNYFLGDYLQRQLPEILAEDPADRLQTLAAGLRDVAGASESRRIRLLREYLAYARAEAIERLQQQYESAPNAPIYWQADVRSIIEANGRALTTDAPPRLADWPEDGDAASSARRLGEDTARMAEALEAWPSLWERARQLGERFIGTD
jgi:hypothetical protein